MKKEENAGALELILLAIMVVNLLITISTIFDLNRLAK